LGLFALDEGRIHDAVQHFDAAIQTGLRTPHVYYALGYSLIRTERFAGAVEPLQQAVASEPGNWRWRCMLGLALAESAGAAASAAQYREVERVKADWQETLNREAWLLATHSDARHRNADQALPLARQLCRATNYREPRFLDTLAAVYAEKGDFHHAIETAQLALGAVAGSPPNELARAIAARLRGYQSARPFRSGGETRSPQNKTAGATQLREIPTLC